MSIVEITLGIFLAFGIPDIVTNKTENKIILLILAKMLKYANFLNKKSQEPNSIKIAEPPRRDPLPT